MDHIFLTVVGGIGILIFAFLLFSNAGPASNLLNTGLSDSTALVKVLQGR